jgi:dGTPase
LTHSLQVAQVGRRLAERLRFLYPIEAKASGGIDPDVVEAACCAHDLGHPPFGHTAEVELNRLAGAEIDGFEGNAQSLRIVTELAQHSTDPGRGLNLTRATLAATLKYPWFRGQNPMKPNKWGSYRSESADFEFAREGLAGSQEPTVEAQIMDWSDDITYSVHDLDDFFRAHRIPLHLFAEDTYKGERLRFIEAIKARHSGEDGWWSDEVAVENWITQLFAGLFELSAAYTGSRKERGALRQFTSTLIGRYVKSTTLVEKNGKVHLTRPPRILNEVAMLKELTWVYVIEAPSLASQQAGQRRVVRELFCIYMHAALTSDLDLFPPFFRDSIEDAAGDNKLIRRTVVDLIAGMTELQALTMFRRLTGVSPGSGLDEIVR